MPRGKIFLGEGTHRFQKWEFNRKLRYDQPARRELFDVLDKHVEHGVNHLGTKIMVGRKRLVEGKTTPSPTEITIRQLLSSLYQQEISPRLLTRALRVLESSLIDCYLSGHKMEIHLENLRTPNLRRREVTEERLQQFYREDHRVQLRFLKNIGVLRFELITLSDVNRGSNGQFTLIPEVPIAEE